MAEEDIRFDFVGEASPQHHDQRAEQQGGGAHGSITTQPSRPSCQDPAVPALVLPFAQQPPGGSQGWC